MESRAEQQQLPQRPSVCRDETNSRSQELDEDAEGGWDISRCSRGVESW